MDRRTIITLGSILVLIVAGFSFLIFNPSAKEAMQKNLEASKPTLTNTPTGNEDSATQDQAVGKYTTYSADLVASTKGTKLIFFHAPWCPQCKELDADIKKQGVPSGVTVFKTDYDSNQALRQEYGVTIQTTVVKVDDDGKLVKKYVAYSEPSLDAVIKNLQ